MGPQVSQDRGLDRHSCCWDSSYAATVGTAPTVGQHCVRVAVGKTSTEGSVLCVQDPGNKTPGTKHLLSRWARGGPAGRPEVANAWARVWSHALASKSGPVAKPTRDGAGTGLASGEAQKRRGRAGREPKSITLFCFRHFLFDAALRRHL